MGLRRCKVMKLKLLQVFPRQSDRYPASFAAGHMCSMSSTFSLSHPIFPNSFGEKSFPSCLTVDFWSTALTTLGCFDSVYLWISSVSRIWLLTVVKQAKTINWPIFTSQVTYPKAPFLKSTSSSFQSYLLGKLLTNIIQKYNNTIVYHDLFPKCVLEMQSLYKIFLITKLVWLLIAKPFLHLR